MRIAHLSPAGRSLVALAVAAGLLVAGAGTVSAHASLTRANIKPGQVFPHNGYPRTVAAYFAENVKPSGSWVHVFEADPKGDHGQVDVGKPGFPLSNPKEITTKLPAGLKGTYTLIWFTTSEDDGHVAGNAYTFIVK